MPIKIGRPFIWIQTRNEFLFDKRNYNMWVQLFLLKSNQSVNLWRGNFPRIDLSEANLTPITITHQQGKNLLTELGLKLTKQVEEMLVEADITISRGKHYYDTEHPEQTRLYRLHFEGVERFPGFIADEDLVAHEEWFE